MDGFSVIVVGQAGVTTGALVTHEDPLLAKLASLVYAAVDPSSDTLYIMGSAYIAQVARFTTSCDARTLINASNEVYTYTGCRGVVVYNVSSLSNTLVSWSGCDYWPNSTVSFAAGTYTNVTFIAYRTTFWSFVTAPGVVFNGVTFLFTDCAFGFREDTMGMDAVVFNFAGASWQASNFTVSGSKLNASGNSTVAATMVVFNFGGAGTSLSSSTFLFDRVFITMTGTKGGIPIAVASTTLTDTTFAIRSSNFTVTNGATTASYVRGFSGDALVMTRSNLTVASSRIAVSRGGTLFLELLAIKNSVLTSSGVYVSDSILVATHNGGDQPAAGPGAHECHDRQRRPHPEHPHDVDSNEPRGHGHD
jgi:hypothetical protein